MNITAYQDIAYTCPLPLSTLTFAAPDSHSFDSCRSLPVIMPSDDKTAKDPLTDVNKEYWE